MRYTRWFLFLSAVVGLLGCSPGFEEEKPTPEVIGPVSINSVSLEDFVSVRVQPTAEPEKYMVYFSWPRIEDQKSIKIRQERTLAVVKPTQTDFNHEVFHDQVLTYTFEVLDSASKTERSFPKQIKIPKDFVVREGQSEFFKDQRISVERIFLSSEIPLVTNGHKIELVAKELRAEGGLIQTFPEGQKAKENSEGRDAGELILTIGSASGSLKILMRGEIGGDGSKGPPHSARAAAGHPAGKGSQDCRCVGPGCSKFYGKPIVKISNYATPQRNTCYCHFGSSGGQGATGAKGNKGLPAQNGGSSGILKVSIQDGKELDLQAYEFPGMPGIPGEGGDGQIGGIGGAGKNLRDPNDCRGGTGPDGPQGSKGDPGDEAKTGANGLICVYIASEGKNDCF